MFTLIVFIVILGLLVLSHEFGHYIAARKSGMKVFEFGFGFPPRAIGVQRLTKDVDGVIQKKWRVIRRKHKSEKMAEVKDGWQCGTIYSFNWFPLGGFVRIKGEEGENSDPDSFVSQSFNKKAITLVAGVAMNVILAAVLFSIGFMIGLPQAVDGLDDSQVKNRDLQILQVMPDMPAKDAGLETGDIILKLDAIENPRTTQMQEYVNQNGDKEIVLQIKRGKDVITKTIRPKVYSDTGKAGIGVAISEVGIVKYPIYVAIYRGCEMTLIYLREIVKAFYFLIVGLFSGQGTGAAVSGPVGIAVMTGQIARLGIHYLINFTALLSLNLAILNILPIPALDGGRLLFLVLGKIFRKQFSLKYEQIAHTMGFFLLMLLVVVVTVKDIGRFSGIFKNLFNKIF